MVNDRGDEQLPCSRTATYASRIEVAAGIVVRKRMPAIDDAADAAVVAGREMSLVPMCGVSDLPLRRRLRGR
jgi:hypothetical protein